jgi:hypothetical protein
MLYTVFSTRNILLLKKYEPKKMCLLFTQRFGLLIHNKFVLAIWHKITERHVLSATCFCRPLYAMFFSYAG